jgi:hypothetical protein
MEVGTRLVVQTGCRPAFRSRLLGQPPRVAVLLELRDNMIRDGVAFVLGQGLLETTNDLIPILSKADSLGIPKSPAT